MRLVLSGIYIKGFKTFARPVRMPLEGRCDGNSRAERVGEEQYHGCCSLRARGAEPGVLRAGAMSELIFSSRRRSRPRAPPR